MQLTDQCDLWRLVLQTTGENNGKKLKQAILTAVPCLRVPISKFDVIASPLSAANTNSVPSQFMHSEARASTDVFLMPQYVEIRPDDELHRGRYTNNAGQLVAFIYTVNGIQTYDTFAYQDKIIVFCTRNS
jgi:hypothetical protein